MVRTPVYYALSFSLAIVFPLFSFTQSTNISTNFNNAGAATVNCGTTNVHIYGFQTNTFGFSSPSFTAINNFQTSGTYAASDILNFKLWRTSFSVFNTSTLVATITTGLGPGNHTFSGFSQGLPFSGGGSQAYFWITCDISSSAVNGRTIFCNAILSPKLVISGTVNYGTNNNGGTQTISCSGFPVELTSFTGTFTPEGHVLEWTTATEINNDFFLLERSPDGNAFEEVARIEGAGTSHTPLHYQVTDAFPYSGISYYRLCQTDFDGKFTYSEIIALYRDPFDKEMFLSPMPVHSELHIGLPPVENEVTITIHDARGRQVHQQQFPPPDEGPMIIFDLGVLPPGVYLVHAIAGNRSYREKFIKL